MKASERLRAWAAERHELQDRCPVSIDDLSTEDATRYGVHRRAVIADHGKNLVAAAEIVEVLERIEDELIQARLARYGN